MDVLAILPPAGEASAFTTSQTEQRAGEVAAGAFLVLLAQAQAGLPGGTDGSSQEASQPSVRTDTPDSGRIGDDVAAAALAASRTAWLPATSVQFRTPDLTATVTPQAPAVALPEAGAEGPGVRPAASLPAASFALATDGLVSSMPAGPIARPGEATATQRLSETAAPEVPPSVQVAAAVRGSQGPSAAVWSAVPELTQLTFTPAVPRDQTTPVQAGPAPVAVAPGPPAHEQGSEPPSAAASDVTAAAQGGPAPATLGNGVRRTASRPASAGRSGQQGLQAEGLKALAAAADATPASHAAAVGQEYAAGRSYATVSPMGTAGREPQATVVAEKVAPDPDPAGDSPQPSSIGTAVGGASATQGPEDASPAAATQAQYRTAERVAEVAAQIARQTALHHARGNGSVRVQLEPEELGRVDVRIELRDGRIEVRVLAETQQVKETIEQGLPQLRAALEQHGLRAEAVSVQAQGLHADLGWTQGRGQQQPASPSRSSASRGRNVTRLAGAAPTTGTITPRSDGIDYRV